MLITGMYMQKSTKRYIKQRSRSKNLNSLSPLFKFSACRSDIIIIHHILHCKALKQNWRFVVISSLRYIDIFIQSSIEERERERERQTSRVLVGRVETSKGTKLSCLEEKKKKNDDLLNKQKKRI
jgi:hypothetical protein